MAVLHGTHSPKLRKYPEPQDVHVDSEVHVAQPVSASAQAGGESVEDRPSHWPLSDAKNPASHTSQREAVGEHLEQLPNDEHAWSQSRRREPWHIPSSPRNVPSLHSSHCSEEHLTQPEEHIVHLDEESRNHPSSQVTHVSDVVLHSEHPGMVHSARQSSEGQPEQAPLLKEKPLWHSPHRSEDWHVLQWSPHERHAVPPSKKSPSSHSTHLLVAELHRRHVEKTRWQSVGECAVSPTLAHAIDDDLPLGTEELRRAATVDVLKAVLADKAALVVVVVGPGQLGVARRTAVDGRTVCVSKEDDKDRRTGRLLGRSLPRRGRRCTAVWARSSGRPGSAGWKRPV